MRFVHLSEIAVGQTLKTKIADAALSIGLRSNEPLPISAGEASAAGEIRLGDIADLKIPTRQSVAQGGEAVKGAEAT